MKKNISPTESINNSSPSIDKLPLNEGLVKMLDSHSEASAAVRKNIAVIEQSVSKINSILKKSEAGRIIYVGAGTSGRIAVQDGVELYPTFGWSLQRLDFIIAGGNSALIKPIENAEDDTVEATRQFNILNVNKNDIVICLAASGNTPFTCAIADLVKKRKIANIMISNNPNGKILDGADFKIILNTGPEVVAGSTRLKAATAQKICLNLISTSLMVLMKRVKDGQMSHLVATNAKLRDRKKRINNEIS